MSQKVLVAYFSASGATARVAQEMAQALGADLYEIRPEQPYSSADLNLMDKKSRSTLEMNDPSCRPAVLPLQSRCRTWRSTILFLSVSQSGGTWSHTLWIPSSKAMILPARQ